MPTLRTFFLSASDGALWIWARGQGVIRLDPGVSRWASWEGLNFQCETPDGAQWFLSQDGGVVCCEGDTWTRYGVEDGLMEAPAALVVSVSGVLMAAGSQDTTAATAEFDGRRWSLKTHPQLSWGIHGKAAYAASDGSVWFGGEFLPVLARGQKGGVLRYADGTWTHYLPLEAPEHVVGIAQTADGALWFGGSALYRFGPSEGQAGRPVWTRVQPEVEERVHMPYEDVYATPESGLWVGSRYCGILQYDGQKWTQYDVRSGLPVNSIKSLLHGPDGSLWASTARGIRRFDGRSWSPGPVDLEPQPAIQGVRLRAARDGAIWFNTHIGQAGHSRMWTLRYRRDQGTPETAITLSLDRVSQPGNTTLRWSGLDPWLVTPEEKLEYAWRLDEGEWSPFSRETSCILQALPAGEHTFQVKARDEDFNEDPTPAISQFTVLPPVWQQPWFILMVGGFVVALTIQGSRIVSRDRKLRVANTALSDANEELFGLNQKLEDKTGELEQTNTALREEMAAREKLDAQLAHLRYLYRLRTALEQARSAEAVMCNAGNVLMEVLNGAIPAGVRIEHDGRQWRFGEASGNGNVHYRRAVVWGGRDRGELHLFCGLDLTEAQERALLDETAGQIGRVLEARELEMQLLQSARLVFLGQMAAGVAHELNQPLSTISTTAGDIYQCHLEGMRFTPDQINAKMRNLMDVVERMESTVGHLRVFSRDTSQEPGTPFFFNDAIVAALKMIQAQLVHHRIAVEVDLAGWLPLTTGHPYQIEQVILNLLANARDALDEKEEKMGVFEKHIRVRTRMLKQDGRGIVAEVEDNGFGMEEDTCQRVFEPFFTTKTSDRGTGLGLSISYAIVKDHGGRIGCESRKGEGTLFRVVVPTDPSDAIVEGEV